MVQNDQKFSTFAEFYLLYWAVPAIQKLSKYAGQEPNYMEAAACQYEVLQSTQNLLKDDASRLFSALKVDPLFLHLPGLQFVDTP